jgi:hypothetical protein
MNAEQHAAGTVFFEVVLVELVICSALIALHRYLFLLQRRAWRRFVRRVRAYRAEQKKRSSAGPYRSMRATPIRKTPLQAGLPRHLWRHTMQCTQTAIYGGRFNCSAVCGRLEVIISELPSGISSGKDK